jgi:excisionase family DNA binding protein
MRLSDAQRLGDGSPRARLVFQDLDASVECVIVPVYADDAGVDVPEPRWYTIKEVAERLRVSHDTVARMVARDELPSIRVSSRIVRIPAPALHRFETGVTVERRGVVRRRVREGVTFGAGEPTSSLEAATR